MTTSSAPAAATSRSLSETTSFFGRNGNPFCVPFRWKASGVAVAGHESRRRFIILRQSVLRPSCNCIPCSSISRVFIDVYMLLFSFKFSTAFFFFASLSGSRTHVAARRCRVYFLAAHFSVDGTTRADVALGEHSYSIFTQLNILGR